MTSAVQNSWCACGEPLLPYAYRDFGSLVPLGKSTTVGSLMGFLFGRGMFIEGLFARLIYSLLRTMDERPLNGSLYAVLATLSRTCSVTAYRPAGEIALSRPRGQV
jgi:NADH dehydrogenase